ncbi:YihY/virulence factor BrkB family protein [Rubrobacter xylanophilus]|uniref:YihY/virulence factor BrkB family protein n=1 Tax=Rubrobacter xylanophilus TaxID=49319 RepID=UPI001C63EBE0|nr:YihY/virulence factor BrkB family protein [Rubrobacter xylanophilus]
MTPREDRATGGRLRGPAERPANGSFADFMQDLRGLMRLRALRATVEKLQRDDAAGMAAQLAYYLILALFPFMLVLVSLMGTFSSPELAEEVLSYFRQVLPEQVYALIATYTGDVIRGEHPAPGLLSFGILLTLWSASGAFNALIKALNTAYEVQETRPFWKVRALAVGMTLGLSGLVFLGVLLMVLGPPIGEAIARYFGFGELFQATWNVARWPVALLFLVVTVALIYYLAPAVDQPFRWITPGGLVAVLLWVVASAAFSFYVNNFGSYNKTYGSIGVAIVLLLYLYISSLTILFGASLNATLARMKEELSGERILEGEPVDETTASR